MTSEVHNIDCMEYMRTMPDKFFELAIVDPPYGIGFSDYERGAMGKRVKERYTKTGKKKWDNNIPNDEYFIELKRVSKHVIVWGGNYFNSLWVNGCKGFIFWYKKQPVSNFASGELAYTDFDSPAKCFDYAYYGNINVDADGRLHPTQKPVALYKWLLTNYAKQGDKILDTHMGSQSSRIAAYDMGFDYYGCELDKEYFEQGCERYNKHIAQTTLFDRTETYNVAKPNPLF